MCHIDIGDDVAVTVVLSSLQYTFLYMSSEGRIAGTEENYGQIKKQIKFDISHTDARLGDVTVKFV